MMRSYILALIALASIGLMSREAHAQNLDPSFNSFFTATINSGAIFKIDGSNATSANVPTGTHTIEFGFASTNTPISLTFTGSVPTGFTSTDSITGIESVYLIADGPSNGKDAVTVTGYSGGTITDYNGSTTTNAAWSGGSAPGANFPSFTDGGGNFGSGDFLLEGSGSDAKFGSFGFNSIALSSTATTNVLFAAHVRESNGNTAFVILSPSAANPEPQAMVLWCGMAVGLFVCGLRARRRQLATA